MSFGVSPVNYSDSEERTEHFLSELASLSQIETILNLLTLDIAAYARLVGEGVRLSLTTLALACRVGVIKIVIVINCNLITFFKIIENNCNSVFILITIIEM